MANVDKEMRTQKAEDMAKFKAATGSNLPVDRHI
jgi:hypothetical protein